MWWNATSVCSRVLGVCTWREQASELSGVLSYKDTDPLGSGPHPMPLFNVNYFLRGLISKYSHTGVKTATCEFWGNTDIQSLTYIRV